MRSSTGVPSEVVVSVEHIKQKETQDTAQENILGYLNLLMNHIVFKCHPEKTLKRLFY